jgi:multiple antibiotic resistance protein
MVFVDQVDGAPALVAVMAGIVGVHVALWLSMRFSVLILRLLGDSGVTLVTRISGLLLSAIAVQLVADAVRAFVTGSGSG